MILLATGFRPFFLLCSLVAVVSVSLWGLFLTGTAMPTAVSMVWHAHEMTFAFGGALLAGFLLTAVPKWTGTKPASRLFLGALVLAFCAGRAAFFVPLPAASVLHGLGAFFVIGLAAKTAWAIFSTASKRNVGIAISVIVFAWAGTGAQLSAAGYLDSNVFTWVHVGVYALILIMTIFGGRVGLLFTRNAFPAAGVRTPGLPDDLGNAFCGAALIALAIPGAPPRLVVTLCLVATVAGLFRMVGWRTWAIRKRPLVLVLHLGFLWIPVGIFLSGLAALSPTMLSAATARHALMAGAFGTLGLAMMTRVTLGHTGRKLVASPMMRVAFVLVVAAGVLRVVLPPAAASMPQLGAVAFLWASCFALYIVALGASLLTARADGKPG